MVLELENLRKFFKARGREVKALDGVTMSVAAGELVAVNGPSGCGKTTLLLAAGGLLAPDGGRVVLDGADLYSSSAGARAAERRDNIGFVFQQFYLIPYLDVLENAVVPAGGAPGSRERAVELLRRFRLGDRLGHKPSELSTGERQRTALARALVNSPKFLLADEPTGNLDDSNAEEVIRALASFAEDGGGVLLVSHDGRTGGRASKRHLMDSGKLLQT